MNLPSDYNSAKAYDGTGSFTPLPVGGHICKIVGARVTKSRNNNDMIEVAFDIAENGPDDGRFNDQFQERRAQQADAKWPNGGIFRTAILTKEGKTSGFFKGLITSVEESNVGYSFQNAGCDEGTLKGKLVGFNFGEEEFKGNDGTIKTTVKAFYAVSVARVREGVIPPPKKLYKPALGESMAAKGFKEVQDDKLPF